MWLKVVWKTEVVSEHWYDRRVRSYDEYALSKRIYQRICELHGQGKLDDEITAELASEGLSGPRGVYSLMARSGCCGKRCDYLQ